MEKCAIVIGVNKTGDLPTLSAAASGAKDFAQWASGQGFQVTALTDDSGARVTLKNIKDAIRAFVDKKTYSQMIVFFAGHGILRGPEYEIWLLSGAPDDPDEAVNVPGSIYLARNAGVPHVVIISDACRSTPSGQRLGQVTGGVIFPNEPPRPSRPAVDVFYATLPGDPSLEAASSDSVARYQGLFTGCLLRGLKGEVSEVVEDLQKAGEPPPSPRWVVPSWKLKPHLESVVPEAASRVSIKLQQFPDIRVESHPPAFLASVAQPPAPMAAEAVERGVLTLARRSEPTFKDAMHGLKREQFIGTRSLVGGASGRHRDALDSEINLLVTAKGRQSFETITGFTVIGCNVAKAMVANGHCDLFNDFGAQQIRVHEGPDRSRSASILVQLDNGTAVALAVLPEFIGTVVVKDGCVLNVSYTPSRNSGRYAEYQGVSDRLEAQRAYAAVATRHGSFRIDRELDAETLASSLRVLKSIDPTLGLYATYAYAQSGDLEQIRSVYSYMSMEGVPVLYDVALLAGQLPDPAKPRSSAAVSPFCPLLTQGWALLGQYRDSMPRAVRDAERYLLPGLWTTFRPEAVDMLWDAIEKGEIA